MTGPIIFVSYETGVAPPRRSDDASYNSTPTADYPNCGRDRPFGHPHRSQRALLTHWAPALDTNVEAHDGERMHGAGRREPPFDVEAHPAPVDPGALAAAPERIEPVPSHLVTERLHGIGVAGNGVVGEMPSHHGAEPAPLFGDGKVPASLDLVLDLGKLGPHPFRDGLALHPEPPCLVLPADVREAQEFKRIRLPLATCRTIPGGVAPELDEPRLVGVQFQVELRKPLSKVDEKLLGVRLVLEPGDKVVGEPHDDHVTVGVPPPPLPDPSVEDVVEVDVGEEGRCTRPLGRSLVARRPRPVLDHPCGQPLLDQPQDPFVRYPVLEKLFQPNVIELGEKVADISVQHIVHLLLFDPDRQRIECVVGTTSRPEPIGVAEEVLLVDRIQHLDNRPLEHLVLQGGYSERALAPVRFRYEHSPRRTCPVGTAVDSYEQVFEVRSKVLPVLLPRDPVHPRSGLGANRPVGRMEAVEVDVMQQCRELCVLVLACYFTHTVEPA